MAIHREINRTTTTYPRDSSMQEQFEYWAENRPDAIAAVQGDREVGYRELNRLANGLARDLRNAGAEPGTIVGVCVPRSPDMLVALLGILKCGASFVPLDPHWPDERFHHVVTNSGCEWLISDKPMERAAGFENRVFLLDARALTGCDSNPPCAASAESIACVYYTSGSTGRPKGVPILHRGINRTVHFTAFGPVDEHSRILQLGALTFDMAASEIWGALLSGGTLVMYPAEPIRLSRLNEVIRAGRVNLVAIPTALFNLVLDEAPEIFDSVATITVGGEAQSRRHMAKALRIYGPGRVFNLYGPTESTCVATCYPIDDVPRGDIPVPIGRPLQNTRLYILADNARTLCGPGQIGEICLAGDGLAAGYLGLPDLTRERFVHRDIAGVRERLYRTGDHGYLLPSGDVVFTGRQDDQVKVNGFRIEPGEISHHLNAHPAVRQCYVTVRDDGDHRSLVAFVVPDNTRTTADSLREHLATVLPRYMVPVRIDLRDALPLTSHGKVDRHALLASREPEAGQGASCHA
ncbi:amino acid adenylation domain-containing protein [Kibdelosporangium banguiense]|uniref:Amino acid adenylation domain-containing protein n=1 Tax=Kibdelosporangium banguiense TaxID=1365924 RepID=A0ABS4TQY5_9PSEU|nr:amino acid adenylation domain-containing protein [Kibdelosporangium banguiense]